MEFAAPASNAPDRFVERCDGKGTTHGLVAALAVKRFAADAGRQAAGRAGFGRVVAFHQRR
jgi:hypothetical protein